MFALQGAFNMKIYQVDAFTEKPFSGNPAGVCVLNQKPEEKLMQSIAREMNLSETAFLVKNNDGYDLRWFTPNGEIDLCGHATLASAHILWEKGFLKRDQEARFSTKSGLLTAKMNNGWIELNFPALPEEKTEPPAGLLEALGVGETARKVTYVGKNIFDYLIEVESEETVRVMKPDFVKLSKVPARGVIVTARDRAGEYDFVSRFFAPEVGIWEDPVTGSAHCCLGPYWQKKLNRDEFIACQASERGGILKVKVIGERVLISGKAVTVLEGELLI
jgi:PhzF family phenazine biosynthesis protein